MPYPESFIAPMREELTRLGVQELRTAGEVDAVVQQKSATVMVVVNSMCGCAAGKARPGVALALRHPVKPDDDFGLELRVLHGDELIESRLSRYGIEPLLLIADQIKANLIAQGWFDPQTATH